ncbi:M1 family metallopeptidase [soil metagenome]
MVARAGAKPSRRLNTLEYRIILLPLRIVIAALALLAPLAAGADTPPGRLQQPVTPSAYELTIRPSSDMERFEGRVVIDVKASATVEQILLNASRLEIQTARIDDVPAFVTADAEQQTVTLSLPDPIEAGDHRIELTYDGLVTDDVEGLYHLDYLQDGRRRRLLATDLEPIGARRILPCFDEPRFKATFKVSAYVPTALTAISNGEVATRRVVDSSTDLVSFEPSPPMSSYLLALFVGPFKSIEDRAGNVRVRVFSTGDPERGREALDASKALLGYYADYFGAPYPLSKLDQIALPNGNGGAMENWGAIAYSAPELLYDPAVDPVNHRRDIWSIVAHEIAHQWFGNLVTMAWWDDLWLNEAFAEWIGAKAVGTLQPGWRRSAGDSQRDETARNDDSLGVVGAIHRPITDERLASASFDSVTYEKGSAVIGMAEAAAGPARFQRGVRRYIEQNRFGNATSRDLWSAQEAEGVGGVTTLGQQWIDTPGLPLVELVRQCEKGQGSVVLTQRPFRFLNIESTARASWSTPVRYATGPRLDQIATVTLGDQPVTLKLANCDAPIKINAGGEGFYRTRYDTSSRTLVLQALQRAADPSADRTDLLDDTLALFRAGLAQPRDLLEIVTTSTSEPDPRFWAALGTAVTPMRSTYVRGGARAEWLRVRAELITALRLAGSLPPTLHAGKDEATERADGFERQARVYRVLGLLNDPATIREARRRFVAKQVETEGPAMADAIMAVAGANATPGEFTQMLDRLRITENIQERRRLQTAIGNVANPDLARRAVQVAIDPDFSPVTGSAVPPLLARAGHEPMVWQFLLEHWDALAKRGSADYLAKLLADTADESFEPARADEIGRVLPEKLGPGAVPYARRAAAWSRVQVQARKRADQVN